MASFNLEMNEPEEPPIEAESQLDTQIIIRSICWPTARESGEDDDEADDDDLPAEVVCRITGYFRQFLEEEPLQRAVVLFRSAAKGLDQLIQRSDLANETPLKVRRINDQLMLLDRSFLDPVAFPHKYAFRHVLWASSSAGQPTFPGLADAFVSAQASGLSADWLEVHRHVSILSQAIEGAAHTLLDVI